MAANNNDETSEQNKTNVKNLKATFENLLLFSPGDNPNWKIQKNNDVEDKVDSSKEKSFDFKIDKTLTQQKDQNTLFDNNYVSELKKFLEIKKANDRLSENFCDDDNINNEEFEKDASNNNYKSKTINKNDEFDEIQEDDYTEHNADEIDILTFIDRRRFSSQCSTNTNIDALTEKNQRQLSNLIKELISMEKDYIDGLERGIQIYVTHFDLYICERNYPEIQGKKFHIFGNIERLFAFHKEKLLPAMLECNEDIVSIAKLFFTYITKDFFYGYILFGLNKPRAEKLSHEFKEVFEKIRERSEDKLGVESFLLKPIQQLPRYKLLFGEIIKALADDFDDLKNVEDIISVCSVAEKQIQRLLDNVNEALNLNDIENAHKIDLWEQGKFKKMNEFSVVDSNRNNRFHGKTFLFERALICTELIQKTSKLKYRTLVILDDVMFIDTYNKTELRIVTKSNREISLISIEKFPIIVIQEWTKLLEPLTKKGAFLRSMNTINMNTLKRSSSLFAPFSKKEIDDIDSFKTSRAKLPSNTFRSTKSKSLGSQPRIKSLISIRSSSERSSISSQDSYDLKGTPWDYRKYLDTLWNIEKHYILLMSIHKHGYIENVPNYKMINIKGFLNVFDGIMNYHYSNIFPFLQENGMDIIYVCNFFKKCLQDPNFTHPYKEYGVMGPKAYETLNRYYTDALVKPGSHMDLVDQMFLQDLKNFIELPFQQLRKYTSLLKCLTEITLCTLEDDHEDIPVEVTRCVASTFLEMDRFMKLVTDIYKLHSKSSETHNISSMGLIVHSDTVVMEFDDLNIPRHKIFLMESAVVAVRLKNYANDDEIFDVINWTIPYELVNFRHSTKINERIKVFSKNSSSKRYSVIFKNYEKKRQFIETLERILMKCINFTSYVDD